MPYTIISICLSSVGVFDCLPLNKIGYTKDITAAAWGFHHTSGIVSSICTTGTVVSTQVDIYAGVVTS